MVEDDTKERFKAIKQLVRNGETESAYKGLCELITPASPYSLQLRAANLFCSLDIETLGLRPLKVALLSSSTIDHLMPLLKFWLARRGFAAEILATPFNSIAASCLNPASDLYTFRPDIIWFFTTWRDVDMNITPGMSLELVERQVESAADQSMSLIRKARDNSNAQIIVNNADIPSAEIFGHLEASAPWSQRNFLSRYNLELAKFVHAETGIMMFDLEHLSATFGKQHWEDPPYWYHSKNAFTFNALGMISFQFASVVMSAQGLAKKCMVLDLDNTLWGGVIGDDGLEGIKLGNGAAGEAFVDMQRYAKALKDRGIILAVCSKNEDGNAREPFEQHPDMQLSLEDIAVFVANWRVKADNIRHIAETLNIGLDSIVFVDDNPVERDMVREMLPSVTVPELPDDPTLYVSILQAGRYFEAVSFSEEDSQRAASYKANAARTEARTKFSDLSSFLENLEMQSEVRGVNTFNLPRAAQLINKSNQFHLTGTRYSEAQLKSFVERDCYRIRTFKLSDRFGDNGLISVTVLRLDGKAMIIDTWVMSCRVLGRQMEEFIINEIVDVARAAGAETLIGCYLPSKKNGLVADLYPRFGFSQTPAEDDRQMWRLDLTTFKKFESTVQRAPTD